MNEQIKQLAAQAGATLNEGFHQNVVGITMTPNELEKFTKLIVGECFYCVEILEKIAHASNADIPPDYDRQTYLKTLETVKVLMKVHFGVEE